MKLNLLIQKYAKNQYKTHSFLRENRAILLLVAVFKVATAIISIYAGYNYFFNLIYQLIDSIAVVTISSIFLLLIVELLTALFLGKMFKFFLKRLYKTSVFYFIGVLVMFTISFISSTNGLATKRSQLADNTTVIVDKYKVQTDNIKNDYSARIEQISNEIESIKTNPGGWVGGKPIRLTTKQQAEIKNYHNEIAQLRNEQKQELNELKQAQQIELKNNDLHTKNEASKYYNFVMIVMFVQFLCSGVLMYFYSRIYEANNKQEVTNELVTDFSGKIINGVERKINTTIKQVIEFYNTALELDEPEQYKALSIAAENKKTDNAKQSENNEPDNEKSEPNEPKKEVHKIGFRFENSVENDHRLNVHRSNSKTRICKYCGTEFFYKHWNKQYCNDECRKKAWEQRTGTKLNKGKNSKNK